MPDKPSRRPSTKTLKRVLDWLREQGLDVYGPCVDLENGILHSACMDYDLEKILKLAALNKRYPDGIPRSDGDD